MAGAMDFNALRAQTLGAGQDEEAVTVNTRALIDKVLARYSGEWTVLRELLQNAADASASKVIIKFESAPSPLVPLPKPADSASLFRHTLLNHSIRSLHVTNDGQPFGPNDWSRLKRIAEGNPDEAKIGAFGVGFYSVFDACEEPFVKSGKEAMAFYWKENSLFTRKLQLTEAQSSPETTFVLDYRDPTSAMPSLMPLCQFLASSLTFVGLTGIELWIDNWKVLDLSKLTAPGVNVPIPKGLKTKTSEGLMKIDNVLHETSQLTGRWLKAVSWKPKIVQTSLASNDKSQVSGNSLRTFFSKFSSTHAQAFAAEKAAKEEREVQEAISMNLLEEMTVTAFMNVHTAIITTSITKSFAVELERATKKPPPKRTKIAVLTTPYDEKVATEVTDGVFASVLSTKAGRIFIGQITHQTTGLAAHISAQSVIPTVERESIDLNARWVRTWNQEMLRACGIVCRLSWMSEVQALQDKISRSMSHAGRRSIAAEDVEQVMPESIHMLNSFTLCDSTPSALVGTLVEEAFWTCNSAASIEIVSSRGVIHSQHVRIGTDELSFVEGIPIVPAPLFEKAAGFVNKLVLYGIITAVTTDDIRKELEAKALDTKQMVEFLKWLTHKAKINELDSAAISSLLEVTVVNDDDTKAPFSMSGIKTFINPSKIPANMPIPADCIPFKYTSGLERVVLESLGWKNLEIVPWVRWLLENAGNKSVLPEDKNLVKSSVFACQVLPIISKQWDGLYQSSKASIVELLRNRSVMPTKLGMRAPSTSYFPTVRLFDDLPLITVNNVKEKFLIALGVRKTIELNLIFNRLLQANNGTDVDIGKNKWNHVDLIRYLASVRNDIPHEDITRLRNTPLCPTATQGGSSSQLYKVEQLFEPTDELKALGLRVLKWPDAYRPGTEDAKFLKHIGLRSYPTAEELIEISSKAGSGRDHALQNRALSYMINFHSLNGYSALSIGRTSIPFLPVEGSENQLSLPSRCYTNETVAMMGFKILRKDLRPYAERFGVQTNMPIEEGLVWLFKNPPESKRQARELFDYFATRRMELSGEPLEMIKQAYIVPVQRAVLTSEKSKSITQYMQPSACFIGVGGKWADIFPYIDFGDSANTFLSCCGAKSAPTTSDLARLAVEEPARVFSTLKSAERYLELLTELAVAWQTLKNDKALVKDMQRSPFLLAYKELPPVYAHDAKHSLEDTGFDEETGSIKTYQLATVDEIVLIDENLSYTIFRESLLAAPMEDAIESFYASLGAVNLSDMIDQRPRVGREMADQKSAVNLMRLIQERIKLFFHDIPRDQIRHDAYWLEKNLRILAVQSISIRKTLKGQAVSHSEEGPAVMMSDSRQVLTLCITGSGKDLYPVSAELLKIVLHHPKPERAIILTTLLETPLQLLRQRGYNVDRILRRKAAEARIAEEARQKQLEEEEMRVSESARRSRANTPAVLPQGNEVAVPGGFPDSPDRDHHSLDRNSLWSQFTSRFNSDGKRFPQLPGQEPQMAIKGSSSFGVQQAIMPTTPQKGPTSQVGKPITAPHELQQNLLNAIKSARSFNGQSVITQPAVNDVQEIQTFCDDKPAQNIRLMAEVGGLKVFVSNTFDDAQGNQFMASNGSALHAFTSVLAEVASALSVSTASLHIFNDQSGTIAFNINKALFFNYRFFENLHLADVLQGKKADAVIYWFVTMAHELSHNLVQDHSAAHSYYTESFIANYFGRIAAKAFGVPA